MVPLCSLSPFLLFKARMDGRIWHLESGIRNLVGRAGLTLETPRPILSYLLTDRSVSTGIET